MGCCKSGAEGKTYDVVLEGENTKRVTINI